MPRTNVPCRRVLALQGKNKRPKAKKTKRPARTVSSSSSSSSFYSTSSSSSEEDEYSSGSESEEENSEESSEEYESSESEEDQEETKDYRRGGYHPVRLGDLYNNGRYKVIRKLGWGVFSTVWLCWDLSGRRYVALKVARGSSKDTEHAEDELKLLTCVREADKNDHHRNKTVQLLDNFKIKGVNGSHNCLVMEILGCSVYSFIQQRENRRGLPIPVVKTMMRQLLEGLNYLHVKCEIIHTDLKPENLLMCAQDETILALAAQAAEFLKPGAVIPASAVTAAPAEFPKINNDKLTKNQKKKQRKMISKINKEANSNNIEDAEMPKISTIANPVSTVDNTESLAEKTPEPQPEHDDILPADAIRNEAEPNNVTALEPETSEQEPPTTEDLEPESQEIEEPVLETTASVQSLSWSDQMDEWEEELLEIERIKSTSSLEQIDEEVPADEIPTSEQNDPADETPTSEQNDPADETPTSEQNELNQDQTTPIEELTVSEQNALDLEIPLEEIPLKTQRKAKKVAERLDNVPISSNTGPTTAQGIDGIQFGDFEDFPAFEKFLYYRSIADMIAKYGAVMVWLSGRVYLLQSLEVLNVVLTQLSGVASDPETYNGLSVVDDKHENGIDIETKTNTNPVKLTKAQKKRARRKLIKANKVAAVHRCESFTIPEWIDPLRKQEQDIPDNKEEIQVDKVSQHDVQHTPEVFDSENVASSDPKLETESVSEEQQASKEPPQIMKPKLTKAQLKYIRKQRKASKVPLPVLCQLSRSADKLKASNVIGPNIAEQTSPLEVISENIAEEIPEQEQPTGTENGNIGPVAAEPNSTMVEDQGTQIGKPASLVMEDCGVGITAEEPDSTMDEEHATRVEEATGLATKSDNGGSIAVEPGTGSTMAEGEVVPIEEPSSLGIENGNIDSIVGESDSTMTENQGSQTGMPVTLLMEDGDAGKMPEEPDSTVAEEHTAQLEEATGLTTQSYNTNSIAVEPESTMADGEVVSIEEPSGLGMEDGNISPIAGESDSAMTEDQGLQIGMPVSLVLEDGHVGIMAAELDSTVAEDQETQIEEASRLETENGNIGPIASASHSTLTEDQGPQIGMPVSLVVEVGHVGILAAELDSTVAEDQETQIEEASRLETENGNIGPIASASHSTLTEDQGPKIGMPVSLVVEDGYVGIMAAKLDSTVAEDQVTQIEEPSSYGMDDDNIGVMAAESDSTVNEGQGSQIGIPDNLVVKDGHVGIMAAESDSTVAEDHDTQIEDPSSLGMGDGNIGAIAAESDSMVSEGQGSQIGMRDGLVVEEGHVGIMAAEPDSTVTEDQGEQIEEPTGLGMQDGNDNPTAAEPGMEPVISTALETPVVLEASMHGDRDSAGGTGDSAVVQESQAKPDPRAEGDQQVEENGSGEMTTAKQGQSSLNPSDINIKIGDLGNACWITNQFSDDIQTRPYRCPEVILGIPYSTPSDIWSAGCIAFELATGDMLFRPRASKEYTKTDDHLARFIELLGPIPRRLAGSGKNSNRYFNRRGDLRRIHEFYEWGLKDIMMQKYKWSEEDATAFTNFVTPMLHYDQTQRATAAECLQHPWLSESQ